MPNMRRTIFMGKMTAPYQKTINAWPQELVRHWSSLCGKVLNRYPRAGHPVTRDLAKLRAFVSMMLGSDPVIGDVRPASLTLQQLPDGSWPDLPPAKVEFYKSIS